MIKHLDIKENLQNRIRVFTLVLLVIFTVILGRLWYLQVIVGGEYKKLAENNRIREINVPAIRGSIYDRNNHLIVKNKPALSVSITPYLLKDAKKVKARLAKLLDITVAKVDERLKNSKTKALEPKIIKKDVNKEVAFYLKEHMEEFPGVTIETLPVRSYPYGSLAAHLLGYVGEVSDIELTREEFINVKMSDIVGKTGIERFANDMLRGIDGRKLLEANAAGNPVRQIGKDIKPTAGGDVVLTLDLDIQKEAEAALKRGIEAARKEIDKESKQPFEATAGAVVVIDPNNGDVIAMASYPTYEPESFVNGISVGEWKQLQDKASNYPLNNRAYTSSYAPGSTFKPFTAIAGIMEGKITPASSFNCTGSWKGSDKWPQVFNCWQKTGHATSDLVRALEVSCDVYFYNTGFILNQETNEGLQKWITDAGFGEVSGIDLPFEDKGRVPTKAWRRWFNRKKSAQWQLWMPGDTINMSIGQGDMLVTPLQLANAYAALANGGTLYKPRLVKEIRDQKGKLIKSPGVVVKKKMKAARDIYPALKEGLKRVTSSGTAAGIFDGLNVSVAGKTGTAQVTNKQDTALFASFAPADAPKYVVVSVIEQGGHGGSVAAPVARDIYAKIFHKNLSKAPSVVSSAPAD